MSTILNTGPPNLAIQGTDVEKLLQFYRFKAAETRSEFLIGFYNSLLEALKSGQKQRRLLKTYVMLSVDEKTLAVLLFGLLQDIIQDESVGKNTDEMVTVFKCWHRGIEKAGVLNTDLDDFVAKKGVNIQTFNDDLREVVNQNRYFYS